MGFPHHVYLCRVGIDQTGNMSELPPRVRELITTPHREEIFKVIATQEDGFTLHGLHATLKGMKINASIASVQNLLKSLSYRGYLETYDIKVNKTRGRSTVHYKKAV